MGFCRSGFFFRGPCTLGAQSSLHTTMTCVNAAMGKWHCFPSACTPAWVESWWHQFCCRRFLCFAVTAASRRAKREKQTPEAKWPEATAQLVCCDPWRGPQGAGSRRLAIRPSEYSVVSPRTGLGVGFLSLRVALEFASRRPNTIWGPCFTPSC